MTDEQKAAVVIANAARLIATVLGMQAENQDCAARAKSITFLMDDFVKEIDASGCHINDIHSLFHD